MSGGVEHLILSGPVLLAIPVAAAAGAITFLSPCCLPLVPGYLSYLTGMSGAAAGRRDTEPVPAAELVAAGTAAAASGTAASGTAGPVGAEAVDGRAPEPAAAVVPAEPGLARPNRSRVVLGTLLFILGFSALFALEGVTVASEIGRASCRERVCT